MRKSDFIKAVIARAILLSALPCIGQLITPAVSGVQGPDGAGKCWINVPKTYQDLSFVEKLAYKAACKKNPDSCDPSMFGSRKTGVTCPVPPKQVATPESKPNSVAPVVTTRELCPEGMQLGVDENGKHLCSDGMHTSEPRKFTPLASTTPAPVGH